MSTSGVIYYNTGTSCAVRLLVSLVSLRRHYQGAVTIISEGGESHRLCEKIAAATGVEIKEWISGVEPGTNRHFLAKTRLHLGTPFEKTIALDSDTLIVGPLDELFHEAEASSFCIAQFAGWRSDGKIISGRIRQWSGLVPDDIEPAIGLGPAINSGVISFDRNASIFQEWHALAIQGREFFIPDEVSCQILLHRHPHKILDEKWNCSCKYDDPDRPDTRIIHFHGKKHCRPGLAYQGHHWVDAYGEAIQQNLADIQSWTPAGDRHLSRHLKSQRRGRLEAGSPGITQHREKQPVYETDLWCRRGHFNRDQADKYTEICERVQPRTAIETGFCTGRSAACVLHNASSSLVRMISIDINLDYKAPHGRRMASLLKERFPKWDVIEKGSREVFSSGFFQSEFPQGIDLAMIDGDHSYEGCTFDLEAVAPFINRKGIIVVDDYRSGPPNGTVLKSVTMGVDDFLERNAGAFCGERWHCQGKGFCIIKRRTQD